MVKTETVRKQLASIESWILPAPWLKKILNLLQDPQLSSLCCIVDLKSYLYQ
ncbi:hypothetical protein FRX31_033329, partial [Thalictrum thalictroides]